MLFALRDRLCGNKFDFQYYIGHEKMKKIPKLLKLAWLICIPIGIAVAIFVASTIDKAPEIELAIAFAESNTAIQELFGTDPEIAYHIARLTDKARPHVIGCTFERFISTIHGSAEFDEWENWLNQRYIV